MTDTAATLAAIEAAATAGEALDAIPEDWRTFLTGPDRDGFACAILPPDGSGPARRIYERGLAMGRGPTRLAAMRKAVAWLRSRTPAPAAA